MEGSVSVYSTSISYEPSPPRLRGAQEKVFTYSLLCKILSTIGLITDWPFWE